MFHKKEIELYQSITAPDTLRTRIMELEAEPAAKPWYQRHTGSLVACACVVLLFCSVLFANLSTSNPIVMVQGEAIGKAPVTLSYHAPYAKASNNPDGDNLFSAILEFDISGNTTITVSDGTIYNIESYTSSGQNITLTKDGSINWTIEPVDVAGTHTLTVTSHRRTTQYTLEQNMKTGIWSISQQ